MLRGELVEAIAKVLSALRESRVIEFMQILPEFVGRAERERAELGDLRHRTFGPEAFRVFHHYAVAAHTFGPVERKVAELFELQRLAEPDFWAMLVMDPRADPDLSHYADVAMRGAKRLSSLHELVAPETIELPAVRVTEGALERFSILVVEEKGQLSRPMRLVNVLQGVTAVYETHAVLLSVPVETLLVATCDSGSDKAFDFLGVASAIQALKETIFSLWDRVAFFRERKVFVSIQLIAEALPVLSEISALAERNAIGPEQAELLRRKVIEGATQLVEAGAIPPELPALGHRNIRVLAAPEPKLLSTSLPSTVEETPKPHPPQGSPKQRRRKKA